MNSRELLIKITEKWHVKILSVAAALFISVFYKMSTLETRFFTVPLKVESANMLVPASSYPQTVKIKLRGENNSIFPILEEDIEAYIDLGKYPGEDTYRIPIQIRKKGSALGIEPLEITVEPVDILVKLEKKLIRSVNISPSFRGFPDEGYEMTSQLLIPSSVVAEGPRSNMEALYEFNTGIIDLGGRYEDFYVIVNIVNNDPLIITHGNKMVEYHATIQPLPKETRIYDEAAKQ
jgi:YbbR domain-containing protein